MSAWLETASVTVYRRLLRLYPSAFRRDHGRGMEQLFKDCYRDAYARRGLVGVAQLWLMILGDWVVSVVRERVLTLRRMYSSAENSEMTRILIAEDDPTSRDVLRRALESWGYDVVAACDGVDAVGKIKGEEFDLVLSDWMMPRMTGVELCASLKSSEETQEIPVIMLCTKKSADDISEAYDAGVDAHLTKPFRPEDLQSRISEALGCQ